ncbi:hypothetical protein [Streptomyces sp. NPDC057496]|uniref:hypothetical protein n=1 Tax=Streptomyces sp. NPDC057496 TaxID=3346149 RepID=UPI0036A7A383
MSGKPFAEGGLTRYRVVAQCVDESHEGAGVLTTHVYARSVEEAVLKVRQEHERPGGLYGDRGLYRVVEVCQEGPSSEERELEAARRVFVNRVMEAAVAELPAPTGVPHSEMYGVLCDFFTRAIVYPDFGFPFGTDAGDTSLHTSDPSRALARLLLEHLTHRGLDLREMEGQR